MIVAVEGGCEERKQELEVCWTHLESAGRYSRIPTIARRLNGGPPRWLNQTLRLRSGTSVTVFAFEVALVTVMAASVVCFTLLLLVLPVFPKVDEDASRDISFLSGFPLQELLAQMKMAKGGDPNAEEEPLALPLLGSPPEREMTFKGLHRFPARKTFYEDDYEEEKSPALKKKKKKKEKHKIHDILNTSISALSYLAFGGYLLCMIVSALREKRRRIVMAYPPAAIPPANAHFASVLQNFMSHRPVRPFIRFPAVTVHQGGRRRRRRSRGKRRAEESEGVVNIVDYVEILSEIGGGNH